MRPVGALAPTTVDRRNISLHDELSNITAEVGLDSDVALQVTGVTPEQLMLANKEQQSMELRP